MAQCQRTIQLKARIPVREDEKLQPVNGRSKVARDAFKPAEWDAQPSALQQQPVQLRLRIVALVGATAVISMSSAYSPRTVIQYCHWSAKYYLR